MSDESRRDCMLMATVLAFALVLHIFAAVRAELRLEALDRRITTMERSR